MVYGLMKCDERGEVLVRVIFENEASFLTDIAQEIELKRFSEMCIEERFSFFRRELKGVVDHIDLRETLPVSILTRLIALAIKREVSKYKVEVIG